MSVLDTTVIARLGTDLGDPCFVRRFVATYRDMLPGRVQRVFSALDADDREDLMDAVLSLRTSATTVGATALAALADDVEQQVRRADPAAARRAVRLLRGTADRTSQALEQHDAELLQLP